MSSLPPMNSAKEPGSDGTTPADSQADDLSIQVRAASYTDIADLQAIERSAAQLFARSPYPELAGFSPISSLVYGQAFSNRHPIWLAEVCLAETPAHPHGAKAGFAYCVPLGDGLHLQELSVHGDFQRRGIGGALLSAVIDKAKARSAAFLSLTTYADIPWNGPFYRRHGFEQLTADSMPQSLRDILDQEIRSGANEATRCVMRLDLSDT
nr:GNAT family N-acetyltransferase [uncultured Cohaesibacter sp.]